MRAAAILLAMMVFTGSLWSIGHEFEALRRAQMPLMARFDTAPQELVRPPGSIEGQYMALETCFWSLSDKLAPLVARNKRQALATRCRALAEESLRRAPSLSLAHLVRAYALRAQGDVDAAFEAVAKSEATGGDLIWMAQARLGLIWPLWPDLPDGMGPPVTRDVTRLAVSPLGVHALAQTYRRLPDRRSDLVDILETLPVAVQQRFLSVVRAAQRN